MHYTCVHACATFQAYHFSHSVFLVACRDRSFFIPIAWYSSTYSTCLFDYLNLWLQVVTSSNFRRTSQSSTGRARPTRQSSCRSTTTTLMAPPTPLTARHLPLTQLLNPANMSVHPLPLFKKLNAEYTAKSRGIDQRHRLINSTVVRMPQRKLHENSHSQNTLPCTIVHPCNQPTKLCSNQQSIRT